MNILITGGASGLGEIITKTLASDSNNFIYFTFCNSYKNAIQLENDFKNVKGIKCDFKSASELSSLVTTINTIRLMP